jgi:hypothetical protein
MLFVLIVCGEPRRRGSAASERSLSESRSQRRCSLRFSRTCGRGNVAGPRTGHVERADAPPIAVVLASAVFLFILVGVLAGYIGAGVTTIRAGVYPQLIGWLLIGFPFLIAVNLNIYPAGIMVGLLWLTLAWVAWKTVLIGSTPIGRA